MKRFIGIGLMFTMMAAGSCQREELVQPLSSDSSENLCLHFSSQPAESKTHWNGTTIEWSEGDRISIAYNSGGVFSDNLFTSEPLTQEDVYATFAVSTDLAADTHGKITFHGIYPSESVMDYCAGGARATILVPAVQTPSAGSYDRNADLMVARSHFDYMSVPQDDIPLQWTRLTAHADVTLVNLDLGNEVIKEISFSAGNHAPLTGQYEVDLLTGKLTQVASSGDVVIDPANISADQDGNYKVWFSVIPASITSLTVKVLTSDAIYIKDISSFNSTLSANRRNFFTVDMSDAARASEDDSYELVRPEHPRMFITSADLPSIKANASGRAKTYYDAMKRRVDRLMSADITFPDPLGDNSNHEIGYRASDAAMLWLISRDETYLEHTKTILEKTIELYKYKIEHGVAVDWYCYSQICALCAYDWIYNDLTESERLSLGRDLYDVMYAVAWHTDDRRSKYSGENVSDHQSGMYGSRVLPWYISIAFIGDGINDARCQAMFRSGYDYHRDMMNFRREMAGVNGGGATGASGYSFGFYPLADFNFYRTYKSATGVDLAEEMHYVYKYLTYLDWVRLPDLETTGSARDFGFGDVHHYQWRLPYQDINYHIYEIANLFGARYPEALQEASEMLSQFTRGRSTDKFAFIRLLHTTPLEAMTPARSSSRKSIHFDTMGQVYMRTGTGTDDTYAYFVSGGMSIKHKHYDNNHFLIYKHGYRCLDSGTRPEPGQHLSHYYSRTVAHNCVTIRMPGETLPDYWGNIAPDEVELPVPNDGGQNELLASELKILRETDDYVYLASDATEAYNSAKASLVMREFVWCMPDVFVVFDRVTSTAASYPKTWLYHTASEPVVEGNEFSETSQGGKSICRTLFPEDAVLEKIGGPGYQFWSDGVNWALPAERSSVVPPDDWPLIGQWRMEVKPGAERTEDVFMHIIQVGDESLTSLPSTTTFDTDSEIGVEFIYNGKSYRIAFDKTSDYGCEIDVD